MKNYANLSSDLLEEKPNAEVFHGFQTIKDVERDRFITGLVTPEFATYFENMMKYDPRAGRVLKLGKKKFERVLSGDHEEPTKLKHNRVTLSELFQKTKEEKTETKGNNFIRKILKRRKSTRDSVRSNDSGSADEKLHKILQMIHLEALAISENMRKYVKKSNEGYRNQHKMLPEDIILFPNYTSISPNQTKNKVSHPTTAGTYQKRERWITSDAEYLILEL